MTGNKVDYWNKQHFSKLIFIKKEFVLGLYFKLPCRVYGRLKGRSVIKNL